jgi:hypothetical protein
MAIGSPFMVIVNSPTPYWQHPVSVRVILIRVRSLGDVRSLGRLASGVAETDL